MKDLALNDCYPASCRLVDNTQFKFGQVIYLFIFILFYYFFFFNYCFLLLLLLLLLFLLLLPLTLPLSRLSLPPLSNELTTFLAC